MAENYYEEVRNHRYDPAMPVMVSVCMIAYNVGKFLPEAIESILGQKTNFRVELIIGEDCSPDDTRAIALRYRDLYPDIIRVLLPAKNQGLTPNSVATQNACTGRYIALCDGDDYWTNENKLQMQVDFLEGSPKYSSHSHQSMVVYDLNPEKSHTFGATHDTEYSIQEVIGHRKFHTSSLLYRRSIWLQTGGIPTTILSNERAIYPMLAIYGPIRYSSISMCIYRKSAVGISSRITSAELELDLNMLTWLKKLDPDFPISKFKSFLHFCTYTYPAKIDFSSLMKHYFQFVFYSFSYFPRNLGDIKYGTGQMFKNLKRDYLK